MHMHSAARPHRGGIVFALGVVSVLVAFALIPLGIVPWILGWRDLRGMSDGSVDPSGRKMTQWGTLFGIGATVLALALAAAALVFGVAERSR
jgi:hypothetical protein